MDNKYSEIVLSREEFEEDLWNEVGETLRILTTAGYECQVYDDDFEIIVIRFNYAPRMGFGNETLEWLSETDREFLENLKDEDRFSDDEKEFLEDLEEGSF